MTASSKAFRSICWIRTIGTPANLCRRFWLVPRILTQEGLRADLHRIAELGDARGLEIIQTQADREGIDLFPKMKTADQDAPNKAHDPRHIALRVFLEHPDLFEAAADHMALLASDRLHEFAGRERGVAVDLTQVKVEAFRTAVAEVFRKAFLGDTNTSAGYGHQNQNDSSPSRSTRCRD